MTDEPTVSSAPIDPFTEAEIVRYARGVITGEYLLAHLEDTDWAASMALMLCAWESTNMPSNLSTMFLVPLAPHNRGYWLNGRVPGVTFSAVMVAVESVEPLSNKIAEMWALLNPDVVIPNENG